MAKRTISVNRDSVCAADDGIGHRRTISIPSDMTVKDIIWRVKNLYLWEVGKRKWIAYSGDTWSGELGQRLFLIDTTFPCNVALFSYWETHQTMPDKIYFKSLFQEPEIKDSEITETFTLYREGWFSRLFRIRNR